MYKEKTLSQFKNMWNKDEESFIYCMELLKDKLTSLEYSQWMFHYYYVNDKFEKAVDYLISIKQQAEAKEFIDFMSDGDFDDFLCCCLPTACCADCGDEICQSCCGCVGPSCGTCCLLYCTGTCCCVCCESGCCDVGGVICSDGLSTCCC